MRAFLLTACMVALASVAVADDTPKRNLVICGQEQNGKTISCQAGDWIQYSGSTGGGRYSQIKVKTDDSVKEIGTFLSNPLPVDGKPIIGGGAAVAIVSPQKAGTFKVTIQQSAPNGPKADPVTITLKVQKADSDD